MFRKSVCRVLQNSLVLLFATIDIFSIIGTLCTIIALIYLTFVMDVGDILIYVIVKLKMRFIWLKKILKIQAFVGNCDNEPSINAPKQSKECEKTPNSHPSIIEVSSNQERSTINGLTRGITSPIFKVEVKPRKINMDYEDIQDTVELPEVLSSKQRKHWQNWKFERGIFTGILRKKQTSTHSTVINASFFHSAMKSFNKSNVDDLQVKNLIDSSPEMSGCCENFFSKLKTKFKNRPCMNDTLYYKRF